jgi:hypothetical protein
MGNPTRWKGFLMQSKKNSRVFIGVFLLIFLATPVFAQYRVIAKRESSNLYQAGVLLVQTSTCLNFALLDAAILTQSSITFEKNGEVCRVIGIFQPAVLKSGTYKVKPIMEKEDFFRVDSTTFIRTFACSILIGDHGSLRWDGTSGVLVADRERCPILQIYTPVII